MEKYKQSAIRFIKTPTFIVPIIIVAIASFGYLLTHSTINVDVLSANRYFQGTELIAQQRIIAPLIDKVFHIMNFYPFLVDFLAVLFLILDAILYCSLWDVISKGKIKTVAYTVFACFFISYPLMMEIFPYVPMGLTISLAFGLVALSIICFYEFLNVHRTRFFLVGLLTLWCAISLYESFTTVYIMGVLSIFLMKILFSDEHKIKLRDHIYLGILYMLPLLLVILFNSIFTNVILNIGNIPKSVGYADKQILYKVIGVADALSNLIHTVIIDYVINAFGYLPITFMVIASIISMIMGMILSIQKKDVSIILIMLGMNITLLLLSIVQGKAAYYRTCQQFQVFVAIIFMLLTHFLLQLSTKKIIQQMIVFAMFLLIFYQVKEIYQLQFLNDIRYQKEKNDMLMIGYELSSQYDVANKPVIFCGYYPLPSCVEDQVYIQRNSLHYKILKAYNETFYHQNPIYVDYYKCVQNSVQPYISWGMNAFYYDHIANIENIKFFEFLGFHFKSGTFDMYSEASEKASKEKMPKWPKEGSIVEEEDYILVNF